MREIIPYLIVAFIAFVFGCALGDSVSYDRSVAKLFRNTDPAPTKHRTQKASKSYRVVPR
jgi:hypothetical protein